MKGNNKTNNNKQKVNLKVAIIGLLEMLVVSSIGLSTAVIVMGTDDVIIKTLLLPQAMFAVYKVVRKFIK